MAGELDPGASNISAAQYFSGGDAGATGSGTNVTAVGGIASGVAVLWKYLTN